MTESENPIEEKKTATAKFAEWLMKRDERRQEKESNLEGLMKFNIFLSVLTLVSVSGLIIVCPLKVTFH